MPLEAPYFRIYDQAQNFMRINALKKSAESLYDALANEKSKRGIYKSAEK